MIKNTIMTILKTLKAILLVPLPICLSAQTLDERHAYRDGDILIRKEINPQSILWGDKGKLADLSEMEVTKSRYRSTVRRDSSDNISVTDRFDCHTYSTRNDSVFLIQLENNQMRLVYDKPQVSCFYPMFLGDSIEGSFSGTGIFCDKRLLRQYGHYKSIADKIGYIVLASGDTLRNVIRIKTERFSCSLSFPMDTIINDIPRSSLDSSTFLGDGDSTKICEVNCCYYATGYRYPILESTFLTVAGKERRSYNKVYYYSPDEQERLSLDETNISARMLKTLEEHSSYPSTAKHLRSYHIDQNTVNRTLNLRYELRAPARIRMLLCDRSGIVYREKECQGIPGSTKELTLDYSGIRRGVYILNINVGGENYSRKFNCE